MNSYRSAREQASSSVKLMLAAVVALATALTGLALAATPASASLPNNNPTAPTTVKAAADASSTTTLDVSWTAATSPDGTSPITGYTVTSTPGSFQCTTTGATTCNVTGLTNKTAYTFTVTATNQYGTSAASTASTSVNAGYPGIPTNVTAVRVANVPNATTGQITVSWTVPNNGGSALTTQTATSNTGSKTCTDNSHITAGTTASCVVTGLAVAIAYTFNVKGVNTNGTGPTSAPTSPSVNPYTLPLAPTGMSATGGNASASVSFTAPSRTNSGAISSYTVTATDTTTAGNGGQTATGSASPITVTGLTNGDSYTFTVTATAVDGTGPASAASAGVYIGRASAPTAVTAATGNGQATVSWTAPSLTGTGITGYTVTATDTTTAGNGGQTASGASSPVTVTGLTNGDSYTFTVIATTANGDSPASVPSAAVNIGRPNAPTTVKAAADASSTTTLDVSWTAATSPDGTSPITGYTVTSTPGSFQCTTTGATTCNVTGLTNKTAYTFTVTATNQYGTSAASTASTSVNAGYPGIPTNVTAVRVANVPNATTGQITVSWTVPNNGGSALTTQTATSNTGSKTCTDNSHITAGTTASCVVTGLAVAIAYTFNVKGVNTNGTGPTSAPTSPSVNPYTLPLAPTGVSATKGNASASVSFTAPSTTNSGAISSYTVTATDTTTAGNGGQTATGSASPITVTGLTNGDSYTFTVAATAVDGTGPESSASAAVIPSTVPGTATNATATAGNTSASVAFTPPGNGGSAITSYTVTATDTTTAGNGGQTATGSASPINVTGLTNGDSYTFTVVATNANGDGVASDASNSVTPSGLPGVATDVTATAGNQSVEVSWTAASDNGSSITGYTVSDGSGHTCTTAETSCTVTGLTNGDSYTFTVVATNANGDGSASWDSNSATPNTAPDAPTNVSGTVDHGQSMISWTPGSDNGSPITVYTASVVGDPSLTCTYTVPLVGPETDECLITGLADKTTYTFEVTATNAAGTSEAGTSSSVTTLSVPDAPTAVTASLVAGHPGRVLVSWSAAVDNGSPIVNYSASIYSGLYACAPTTALSCTIDGVPAGWGRSFYVTATNALGTGDRGYAEHLDVVWPTTPPRSVKAINVAGHPGQVTVSWAIPRLLNAGDVLRYDVTNAAGTYSCWTTGLSCTISGVNPGSRVFAVTATNAGGTSPSSAWAPLDVVWPPTAPRNVSASNVSGHPGKVLISWTAPASNMGGSILHYDVANALGNYTCAPTTELSCTISGVAKGIRVFSVTATNVAGTSTKTWSAGLDIAS